MTTRDERILDTHHYVWKHPHPIPYSMKCPSCSCGMIWGGDHSYEDYGIDDEDGIVSNLACPAEGCSVETIIIYTKI